MKAGARIGEGREAEVFAWGDDAVVKLYRPGFAGHAREAAALLALEGHGVAPRLLDVVDLDGRVGVVMTPAGGTDVFSSLERRPRDLFRLAARLAATHVAVHEVEAPGELPAVRDRFAARIDDGPAPPDLKRFALGVLEGLPAGDRLLHGDFHPANVLLDGDHASVIDWPAASRGVPEADVARTLLLLRWADTGPGTSRLSRVLVATGRAAFASAYRRAYRARAALAGDVGAWFTVNVAARMSEGIEAEFPRLLRHLARERARA